MKLATSALLALFISTAALAQKMGDQVALRKYCEQLVQVPKQKGIFWQVGGDVLRRMFHPSYYAKVESFMNEPRTGSTSDDEAIDIEPAATAQGQNLIFSLAPTESISDPEQLKKDVAEYKKVSKIVGKMRNEQYRLRKTRNVDACVQKANEDGFDLTRFVALLKRKFDLFDAEMAMQAKTLHKQFRRIENKLKLKWTLVPVTHLDDLKAALNRPETRNVIILHHSTEAGQLVDSSRNGYPDSFFKFVSPALQSLTIFACHTQSIRKVYSLERNIKSLSTSKEFTYLGMKQVTPMEPQVLKSFLKKIDASLAERQALSSQSVQPASQVCKISVEGVTPKIGEFGIFVSGIYVGAIRNGQSSAIFSFPCEQVEAPVANQDVDVRIATLSLIDRSDAAVLKAKAVLTTPNGSIEFTQAETFDRQDKSIYSVLFTTVR